jgi:O-Antigen ligase
MGGEGSGGRQYFILLGAIVGYFALSAQRVPQKRIGLYVAFFLLSGITAVIGDVFYFQSRALQYLYAFFPPNIGAAESRTGILRLGGLMSAASVIGYFLLAKYGIRGLFLGGKPWRALLFLGLAAASLLGGFRSGLIGLALVFAVQFYLEGLHRTKLLPILLFAAILAGTVTLPFIQKLPYSIQRTLSFLPIPVDPIARLDAEGSTKWRVELWKSVLPQVPKYLFLGKGYSLTREDVEFAFKNYQGNMQAFSEDQSWAAIVGDYHNGPLSVLIPFGIWGALAFLWFLGAGLWVLHRNYRYGDSSLQTVNTFLLAMFGAKALMFLVIFGSLYSEVYVFVGYLGLSISLNGGVCRKPAVAPVEATVMASAKGVNRRLRPAFQNLRTEG